MYNWCYNDPFLETFLVQYTMVPFYALSLHRTRTMWFSWFIFNYFSVFHFRPGCLVTDPHREERGEPTPREHTQGLLEMSRKPKTRALSTKSLIHSLTSIHSRPGGLLSAIVVHDNRLCLRLWFGEEPHFPFLDTFLLLLLGILSQHFCHHAIAARTPPNHPQHFWLKI